MGVLFAVFEVVEGVPAGPLVPAAGAGWARSGPGVDGGFGGTLEASGSGLAGELAGGGACAGGGGPASCPACGFGGLGCQGREAGRLSVWGRRPWAGEGWEIGRKTTSI
ncbi:hypothetical protein SBA2_860017 [Acidobacteriia bacterium SbA2]|nr:hypothetical protein SBA2_860017 [Acidobacteriia bacterium SbA2]